MFLAVFNSFNCSKRFLCSKKKDINTILDQVQSCIIGSYWNDLSESLFIWMWSHRFYCLGRDVKKLHHGKEDKKLKKKSMEEATSLGLWLLQRWWEYLPPIEGKIQIAEKTLFPYFPKDRWSWWSVVRLYGSGEIDSYKAILDRIYTQPFCWRWHCLNIRCGGYFLGGKLLHEAKFCARRNGVNMLAQLRVDLCNFGALAYLDPVFGLKRNLTGRWSGEAGADSRKRKKRWFLSFQNKLHSIQKYKTCDLTEWHTLVTELDPSESHFLDGFRPLWIWSWFRTDIRNMYFCKFINAVAFFLRFFGSGEEPKTN